VLEAAAMFAAAALCGVVAWRSWAEYRAYRDRTRGGG
jgi:hypothetical protein